MKNAIRCCISCILPCGALDVIRIVHTNGRVEEISGSIRAADVMKLYPKHVLKKPSSCSSSADDDHGIGIVVPKIVIVPPDAELQRGKIYFLMPLPPDHSSNKKRKDHRRSNSCDHGDKNHVITASTNNNNNSSSSVNKCKNSVSSAAADVLVLSDDRYLSELMSEKVSATQKDHRRKGRAGVWRPHLESISESTSFLNIPTDCDDDDEDSF